MHNKWYKIDCERLSASRVLVVDCPQTHLTADTFMKFGGRLDICTVERAPKILKIRNTRHVWHTSYVSDFLARSVRERTTYNAIWLDCMQTLKTQLDYHINAAISVLSSEAVLYVTYCTRDRVAFVKKEAARRKIAKSKKAGEKLHGEIAVQCIAERLRLRFAHIEYNWDSYGKMGIVYFFVSELPRTIKFWEGSSMY